jgi:circadian clock protein KaiC
LHSSLSNTGVPGLDNILCGGLPRGALYLIDGNPGVGKTTLALQYLLEGVRSKERCLYITLSETRAELEAVAKSHGWTLGGIDIIELSAIERSLAGKAKNTMFQSAEVELNQLSKLLLDEVERIKPARVVLDSLSEMRLLAQNPLRYRRQILTFKQRFAESGATVLLLDDRSAVGVDVQVHSIVHGLISLSMAPVKYGIFRRTLSVTKLRGVEFREGNHDYVIRTGGLTVFARLVAADHHRDFKKALQSSGNEQFDQLTGGGLHTGTANLLMGPAGSGKSTIAVMFADAAAKRGQRVSYYAFDEATHILRSRATEMGISFEDHIKAGKLVLSEGWHQARGAGQPERLRQRHAGRGFPVPAPARAAHLPEPAGRADHHDPRAARPGRLDGLAGGRELPCRHRDPDALFRGARRGEKGDLGDQEAQRPAREHAT